MGTIERLFDIQLDEMFKFIESVWYDTTMKQRTRISNDDYAHSGVSVSRALCREVAPLNSSPRAVTEEVGRAVKPLADNFGRYSSSG